MPYHGIDNSDNEDGFKIERKIGLTGRYEQIAAISADVVSWSDTAITVIPGMYYYYRIRAYNVFGESTYSEALGTISGNYSKIAAGGDILLP